MRVVQQNSGESQPLRLAARECVCVCVALKIEVDDFEHFLASASSSVSSDPIGCRKELEVFNHLHVVVHAEEIGHVTDEPSDFLGVSVDRMPADVRFAPRRLQERGDDSHRRRFTGSIGPNKPEQVAFIELQVDRSNGEHVAVFLRKVDCLDHGMASIQTRLAR